MIAFDGRAVRMSSKAPDFGWCMMCSREFSGPNLGLDPGLAVRNDYEHENERTRLKR